MSQRTSDKGREFNRSTLPGNPDYGHLFIIDGSIFVTAAVVNPINTIQALALHVAETMKRNLANLFDD